MGLWLKSNAKVLLLIASFALGALVNNWYRDSKELEGVKVDVTEIKKGIKDAADFSAKWETQLKKINKDRRASSAKVKTIVERPVYLNKCIDADGLREINAAKNGSGGSGEPSTEVRASTGP